MDNAIISKVEEERRIKEFKALYYELNAKPDSTTKLYNEKVVVTKDDIERLDNLIREKMALHVKNGEFGISNVVVNTSKNKAYSFNDFTLFATYNWNLPENINSMTLSWDFFVNVEGYQRPQRHKLTVKISAGMKIEEVMSLLFSGRIEDVQEIEEQQATIIAQMDFVDGRLGQEFINIVGEWVDTLQRAYSDKNKFILSMKKYRKHVGYYFNYSLFILISALSLIGLNYYLLGLGVNSIGELKIGNIQFIINYSVLSVLLCIFVETRGESVANYVFRMLSEYGESFVFRITKGDENKYNKLSNDDKENATKIIFRFVFSLILNVVCGIIASILYSKL